jgi:Trk K+ transport system NAD-binding subunit
VVGIGQVGVRLCAALRAHGVPVVGIERDRHATHVALARRLGIPVIVGDGSSRAVLERVRLDRCMALAAVGSNDLDNVAVAVAASAVAPSARVILRAGEQEAVEETRALMPLGAVRDITEIAATLIVARLSGVNSATAAADEADVYVRSLDGDYEHVPVRRKSICRHISNGLVGSP